MKRFHVQVAVSDLKQSVGFYSTLFGTGPTVEKSDYAKWMLDDPRINFSISARAGHAHTGVDHLGIQVETEDELAEIDTRLKRAEQAVLNQTDAACCYARSDKAWSVDPSGISWEAFLTHGEIAAFGGDTARGSGKSACCAPAEKSAATCC